MNIKIIKNKNITVLEAEINGFINGNDIDVLDVNINNSEVCNVVMNFGIIKYVVRTSTTKPIRDSISRYNINDNVIIYPNEKGWERIRKIISNKYNIFGVGLEEFINNHKTENNGYKEQLWVVISDFSDMYFNGQNFFETTWIDLIAERKN